MHHRTNLSCYIFATQTYIDNRKKLVKQQYLIHVPHNMVNFGPVTAEISWRVGAPQQISASFASWLHYCTDVAQRRSTKLCMKFGRLLSWYAIYTFLGALAPNGISQGAKFTLHPSIAFSYISGVTARQSSTGRQPNFAAFSRRR